MPQPFKAKVTEHSLLKGDFHWIVVDLQEPHTLEFKPGQFLMLDVPGIPAKKAYSIASSPATSTQVHLLIDVGPQGDGTLYLQSLKPGDDISFSAPAGLFFLADNPDEQKYVMVATGSGISAVRSQILWLLQAKQFTGPVSLHWGMRYVQDIFWEDEFRMLERQFPNFHFDLVLSKAPEGWPLCTGHINDCLANHYQDYAHTGFYMCGNPKMIEGVSTLLESKGVNPANIHHERFG
jgi:Na+-transporting NADH:ubiquinone oxidoreductase subunit F